MSSAAPWLRRTPAIGRGSLPALAGVGVLVLGLAVAVAAPWPVVVSVLALPVALAVAIISRRDAVTVLCIFSGSLLFIPARFAFNVFSESLTPALLVGVLAFWLWACLKLVPALGLARGPQPVRPVASFVVWSGLASLAAAFTRSLPDVEMRGAEIGILMLLGAAGVALLAADGITSRQRLDTFLRWLVVAASLTAVIGVVQFTTGFDPSKYLRFPGLEAGASGDSFIDVRSSLRRVEGTAGHPLDFALLMTVMLPLAVHYARSPDEGRRRLAWWGCVAVLIAGNLMSVSRAGVIGIAVCALILIPTWPRRQQLTAVVVAVLGALVVRVAIPGLMGTLLALFNYLGTDPSITHRTGDYSLAAPYIAASPVFGRGFHTWIPLYYFIIDNQYLTSLIETGLVGVVAMLAIFVVGLGTALWARHLSTDQAGRDLALCLAAGLLSAGVTYATFDAFGFSISRGIVFILLGCTGALWRLQRERTGPQHSLRT